MRDSRWTSAAEQALRERREARAIWLARHVIPQEPGIRAWLRRGRIAEEEMEDLVQEAYYRMSAIDSVDHIEQPGAYFFSLVRNLLARRLRQAPLVQLEAIAEIESIPDPRPDAEREVGARRDYARLERLLGSLSNRDQTIIRLRKIDGLSQREISAHLGVTESIIENVLHRSLRAILSAWEDRSEAHEHGRPSHERRA